MHSRSSRTEENDEKNRTVIVNIKGENMKLGSDEKGEGTLPSDDPCCRAQELRQMQQLPWFSRGSFKKLMNGSKVDGICSPRSDHKEDQQQKGISPKQTHLDPNLTMGSPTGAGSCIDEPFRISPQRQVQHDLGASCRGCAKRFTWRVRRRQCQRCRLLFCKKCVNATNSRFSSQRLCTRCMETTVKEREMGPGGSGYSPTASIESSVSPVALEKPSSRAGAGDRPERASRKKACATACCTAGPSFKSNAQNSFQNDALNISALDEGSVCKEAKRWAYAGPRPQSIFDINDQEIALNLSIGDGKCNHYKVPLIPTRICRCFQPTHDAPKGHAGSPASSEEFEAGLGTEVCSVSLVLREPTHCSEFRIDMYMKDEGLVLLAVRMRANGATYTGITKVNVQPIRRQPNGVGILFIDDLDVMLVNIDNNQDDDSFNIAGSLAWKLFPRGNSENRREVHSCDSTIPVLDKEILLLQNRHDDICKEEHVYLEQFQELTNKLEDKMFLQKGKAKGKKRRASSGAAVFDGSLENDAKIDDGTSVGGMASSLGELRLAKDNAWRNKETTSRNRSKLNKQRIHLAFLKKQIEQYCFEDSEGESSFLSMWCPKCSGTLQVSRSQIEFLKSDSNGSF